MSKEDVYDQQIAPLMSQIIAICLEHQIPVAATFHTPSDTDPDLCCSTALLRKEWEPPQTLLRIAKMLDPGHVSPLLINVRDEDGILISSTAVL